MKKCKICGIEKELNEFNRAGKYYQSYCKICERKRAKKYKLEHKEHYKEYDKQYYLDNKEQIKNKTSNYRKNNKTKRNQFEKSKRKSDKVYKYKIKVRNELSSILRKNSNRYILKYIGCSKEKYIDHMINTYKKRYGEELTDFKNIHIDHIKPLITAKTIEEVNDLCHYTNLQLLKAKDNLEKGFRY